MIVGFLVMFEVLIDEVDESTDEELTDIFNCKPVCCVGADFDCLLLTETCELRVDWFPIVTSSLRLNPDLVSLFVEDCSCADCPEGISVLGPPI